MVIWPNWVNALPIMMLYREIEIGKGTVLKAGLPKAGSNIAGRKAKMPPMNEAMVRPRLPPSLSGETPEVPPQKMRHHTGMNDQRHAEGASSIPTRPPIKG